MADWPVIDYQWQTFFTRRASQPPNPRNGLESGPGADHGSAGQP